MLGNDVVDLTIDNKKHLKQRFIHRVLSTHELRQLDLSLDKNQFLWSLWAIKEASYKACQKLNLQLLFSPSQFALNDSSLSRLNNHNHHTDFYATLQHQNTRLQLKLSWLKCDVDEVISHTKPPAKATAVHATAISSDDPEAWQRVQVVVAKMTQPPNHKDQSTEVRKLAQTLLVNNDISANIHRPLIQMNDYTKQGPPILLAHDNRVLAHEISLSHDHDWLAVALMT